MFRTVIAAAIAAAVIVVAGATGAVANHLATSADIKNHSVRGHDLSADSIGYRHLRPHVTDRLTSGAVLRVAQSAIFDPGVEAHSASCPDGAVAVGGGVQVVSGGAPAVAQFTVAGSYPQDRHTWTVDGTNAGTEPLSVRVHAVCLVR